MAETFKFDLVSPERRLASAEAEMVQIPGMEGEFTALPQHAPFLTTLRPGVVTIHAGGATTAYFVTGGFAEISPEAATVLAEEAIESARIDRGFLNEKLAEAEAALADAPDGAKIAAGQRVNDFRAIIDQLGL
jgi:F-type H+-transporting ATPase subunit epsilon